MIMMGRGQLPAGSFQVFPQFSHRLITIFGGDRIKASRSRASSMNPLRLSTIPPMGHGNSAPHFGQQGMPSADL
jgi:hypothetical protein